MTAVFASQGWGQLSAGLVALIVTSAFKDQIIADPDNYAHYVDFCWRLLSASMSSSTLFSPWLTLFYFPRLLVGLGAIPGAVGLYFRLTLPETPRFTMDIERNVKQASSDINAFLTTGEYVEDLESGVERVHAPVATRRDFIAHFSKWENGKVLLGCAWSWFALGESADS